MIIEAYWVSIGRVDRMLCNVSVVNVVQDHGYIQSTELYALNDYILWYVKCNPRNLFKGEVWGAKNYRALTQPESSVDPCKTNEVTGS